jgi:hypothetical protein
VTEPDGGRVCVAGCRIRWDWLTAVAFSVISLGAGVGCTHAPRDTFAALWKRVPGVKREAVADAKPPAEPKVAAMQAATVADPDQILPGDPMFAESQPTDIVASDTASTLFADGSSVPTWEDPVAPTEPIDWGVARVSSTAPKGSADDDEPLLAIPDLGTTTATESAAETATDDSRVAALRNQLATDAASDTAASLSTNRQPLRLRVDGLVARARSLLQSGQLRDARRNAQLAQDLSESAELEIAPGEGRPTEVLREIEAAIAGATASVGPSVTPRGDAGADPFWTSSLLSSSPLGSPGATGASVAAGSATTTGSPSVSGPVDTAGADLALGMTDPATGAANAAANGTAISGPDLGAPAPAVGSMTASPVTASSDGTSPSMDAPQVEPAPRALANQGGTVGLASTEGALPPLPGFDAPTAASTKAVTTTELAATTVSPTLAGKLSERWDRPVPVESSDWPVGPSLPAPVVPNVEGVKPLPQLPPSAGGPAAPLLSDNPYRLAFEARRELFAPGVALSTVLLVAGVWMLIQPLWIRSRSSN